ncbi:MAG TPA: AraC family transcriptional regulator [Gemmatimonadales bacterium]|nr:AraC family transcriptional regulator [Gemmatimonadales bacterium]
MKPDTRLSYEAAVRRTIGEVVTGLDRALDLEALARTACLSPFHFHRVFRGMVGETPLELHRRLRLERAAWQLAREQRPVTQVAFDAGYETHESFTRAFREYYSCSPSEFRQRQFRIPLASRTGLHFPVEPDSLTTHPMIRGTRPMLATVKNMPELHIAAVAHRGPYNRINEAFSRLDTLVRRAHILDRATALLAIFHDDPELIPVSELRSDAGVVVPPGTPLSGELVARVIPAGRYACATHTGPYERLGDTWARLMGEWLPQSEHRVAEGVSYEIYRNTPADTAPDGLITDLYIPLE